jgi:hypothetical protein
MVDVVELVVPKPDIQMLGDDIIVSKEDARALFPGAIEYFESRGTPKSRNMPHVWNWLYLRNNDLHYVEFKPSGGGCSSYVWRPHSCWYAINTSYDLYMELLDYAYPKEQVTERLAADLYRYVTRADVPCQVRDFSYAHGNIVGFE